MSKAEILRELPKLGLQERREIFECTDELEDQDLGKGGKPSAADEALLDRELEEYRQIGRSSRKNFTRTPTRAHLNF